VVVGPIVAAVVGITPGTIAGTIAGVGAGVMIVADTSVELEVDSVQSKLGL